MWFNVDDKAHAHKKHRRLGKLKPEAGYLWYMAGSWCADNTTDGEVPADQLDQIAYGATEEWADALVAVGLWVVKQDEADAKQVVGGASWGKVYVFHQWAADGNGASRNLTRAQAEERRQKKSLAGRLGGLASGKARGKHRRTKDEADAKQVLAQSLNQNEPHSTPSGSYEPEREGRSAVRDQPAGPQPTDEDPYFYSKEDNIRVLHSPTKENAIYQAELAKENEERIKARIALDAQRKAGAAKARQALQDAQTAAKQRQPQDTGRHRRTGS